MKKRVADIVVDILIEKGITDCFSVVGGGAMQLNNAFVVAKDRIRTIYNHHEQACSMAAEGYARLTGKMAAVCVTSGPGGTNAINGVQGAWVDSIPMLIISGHPRYTTTVAATGLKIRTRGVQENDIIAQVKSITKYAKLIDKPEIIREELEKAIYIATTGRRGPVWIDIPLDVQGFMVEEDKLNGFYPAVDKECDFREKVAEFRKLMSEAKRPCILTGSGIRTGSVINEYKKFLINFDIPIVGGALQADINYNGEKNYFGMSGSIGPRCGNFILQSADLILVLGNSLSFKQTGFNQQEFAKKAKIVMVDAEADECKKPGLNVDLFFSADLRDFFDFVQKEEISLKASQEWFNYCQYVMEHFPKYEMLLRHGQLSDDERVPSLLFWQEFMKRSEKDTIIALGNSNCILGILQEGTNYEEQRVIVNYNCGSMGDDLPGAIGAAIGSGKAVYCVTGDGSFMMNMQELETISYNKLPIKIILFNNEGYGAIRNTCTNFFNGVYTGCDVASGIGFPNFEKIAEAFELDYCKCSCIGELQDSIEWVINNSKACLVEVYERIDEINGPKLASKMNENGEFLTPPLHDMSPFLDKQELERFLI